MGLIVGLIVLILVWQHRENIARRLAGEPFTTLTTKGHGLVTDLGQSSPEDDRGRVDGLTSDDVEWAQELGAETEDEILDLVRKHEESLG